MPVFFWHFVPSLLPNNTLFSTRRRRCGDSKRDGKMSFDEDLLRANRSALTHASVLYAFSYEEVIRTRRVPEMEDEGGSVAVWY